MGAASACFLARDHRIDRHRARARPDLTRKRPARCRPARSASSSRSRRTSRCRSWSLGFLRRAGDELAVAGDRPSLGLVEPGYLYLATESGVPTLRDNHAVQRAAGADVACWTPAELQAHFPLAGGGRPGAGLAGPERRRLVRRPRAARRLPPQGHRLRCALRAAEAALRDPGRPPSRRARCADGRHFDGDAFVLCRRCVVVAAGGAARAGPAGACEEARRLRARVAGTLPGCPLVIGPSGLWFRPDGNDGRRFLAGAPPREPWPGDPDEPPLHAIDHAQFDEQLIWPRPGRARAGLRGAARALDLGRLLRDEPVRPQRPGRAACPAGAMPGPPAASPATACSSRPDGGHPQGAPGCMPRRCANAQTWRVRRPPLPRSHHSPHGARPARRAHPAGAAKTGHLGPTIFRSTDFGRSWQEAARPPAFAPAAEGRRGAPCDHTFWLTPATPASRGTWYAGTSPQGLFRSDRRRHHLGAVLLHQRRPAVPQMDGHGAGRHARRPQAAFHHRRPARPGAPLHRHVRRRRA
jgi:FAD-dependent oxidoreductase domain-containing protein 1